MLFLLQEELNVAGRLLADLLMVVLFQEEFKAVVRVLEDAILATDLALFFKRRKETLTKVQAGICWQVCITRKY